MGGEEDRPLFQYLILQLQRHPRIHLVHVKDHLFRGNLRIYTLSEEVPRYRVEEGIKKNCVARKYNEFSNIIT